MDHEQLFRLSSLAVIYPQGSWCASWRSSGSDRAAASATASGDDTSNSI